MNPRELAPRVHCGDARPSAEVNSAFGLRPSVLTLVLLLLGLVSSPALCATGTARAFATPQEAVSALDQAVNTTNRAAFAALFGPEAEELANPDSVQGARELATFAAAFNATNRLVARVGYPDGARGRDQRLAVPDSAREDDERLAVRHPGGPGGASQPPHWPQ